MLNLNKEVPLTDGRYLLNVEGDVVDLTTLTVVSRIEGSAKLAKLNWFDGDRDYEVGLITILSIHTPKIPVLRWTEIKVHYKDLDATNTFPSNLYYSFDKPVPVKNWSGFYHIPYATSYGIDINGRLLDIEKGELRRWWVRKPSKDDPKNRRLGYRVNNIIHDRGTGGNISRHRALALTFLPYDADPKSLVVNHKDGIGGNDWISNLEWNTHSGNTQHAYDNGLQPNNVRTVLVKDEETGNIRRYESIAACCRNLGYTHTKISHRLRCNPGKTYSDGIAVKLDDDTPWEEGRVTAIKTDHVLVRNVFTGETILTDSPTGAQRLTDVDRDTIWAHMDRQSTIPWKGFLFRRGSDEEIIFPEYSKWQLELFMKDRPRSDVSGWLETDTETDDQVIYLTSELAERLGKSVSRTTGIAKQGTSPCGRYTYEKIEPEGVV